VRHWSLIICILVLVASDRLSFAADTSLPLNVLGLYSFTHRRVLDDLETLKSASRFVEGSYLEVVEEEKNPGRTVARVLSRGKLTEGPIMHGPPALAHMNWCQLRRWNIPESSLPPAWSRDVNYVVAGLILILVQSLLIIGLLLRRARDRKSELRLFESEQSFRLMAETTPALVWMCDKLGNVTYLNKRRIEFTGRDLAGGLGDVWSTFIHPDDLQNVFRVNSLALERHAEFSREYRLRRRDGMYRWILDVAAPRINGNGLFAGFIGSAVDITDQKLAREALENIGGKLIEAQEEERRRIARELHDDICQRLVLLSMELEQANRGPNSSSGSPNPKLEEIRRHCAEIAGDVQALSHKLHSSKLEYLGTVAAVRSFCNEFSQQHEVSVQFTEENIPGSLPRDISLSLFRVTQEALQNALKHSGTSRFSVSLRGTADEIQLEVCDEGAGFEMEEAKQHMGLGLVSMRERVHLVHGTFTIDSRVNCGTRILVRVPVVAEMKTSATVAKSA
jgi:PAS domain S-box-containing protein